MSQPESPSLVRIVIYIHGGICQEVKTNLPEASWEYAVVDFDNEPDLPDGHIPYSADEMKRLPSLARNQDLISAAKAVISNWETGDLAAAVRRLAEIVNQMET